MLYVRRSSADSDLAQRHAHSSARLLRTGGRTSFAVSAFLAALLIFASLPTPALTQGAQVLVVDVRAVAEGYRISRLAGRTVKNGQNEEIGRIDDFIIGKADRSLYVILEIGGFLGIGARLVAISYDSLSINEDGTQILFSGATIDALSRLPAFHYIN